MNGDTGKKLIGTFGDGAKMYSLINPAKIPYFIIERKGREWWSTEKSPGQPAKIIRDYCNFYKTHFTRGEE